MILHYLSAAAKSYRRHPFTATANVLTLAFGLTCFVAAHGIAQFWAQADRHLPNAERIFTILHTAQTGEGTFTLANLPATSRHVAPYLRADFEELEAVARVTRASDRGWEIPVEAGGRSSRMFTLAADSEFIQIFGIRFLAGDAQTALRRPQSAVVTREAAAQLFGGADALGEAISLTSEVDVVVTGIVEQAEEPSHLGRSIGALPYDLIVSYDTAERLRYAATAGAPEDWLFVDTITYVLLPESGSLTADGLTAQLPGFVERHVPAQQLSTATLSLSLFPVVGMLGRLVNDGPVTQGGVTLSMLLYVLGGLILLIACVNFTNLAAAHAVERTREIALRKVIGANRGRVMRQYLAEAGVSTALALVAALVLIMLLSPLIATATGIDFRVSLFRNPAVFGFLVLLLIVVTLLAGAYPTLVLGHVRPIAVLQAAGSPGKRRRIPGLLVGLQFTAVSVLVIGVIVTYLQNNHARQSYAAPESERLVVLRNESAETRLDQQTLHSALRAMPGVLAVTAMDPRPWAPTGVLRIGSSPEPSAPVRSTLFYAVADDFFATFDRPLLAGRPMDEARDDRPGAGSPGGERTRAVVIDRSLSEELGFDSPQEAIGATLYVHARNFSDPLGDPEGADPIDVVGVVEDAPLSISSSVGRRPSVYHFYPKRLLSYNVVRLSGRDMADTIDRIDAFWQRAVPGVPIDRRFVDEDFEAGLGAFTVVNRVFLLLAGIAIFIAVIGLWAMTFFAVQRRSQEVAVRKVLGADRRQVAVTLLAQLFRPVIVANVVAWPIAYLVARAYLSLFLDPLALTFAPFAAALAATVAIALLAVSGLIAKAARTHPARALRCE